MKRSALLAAVVLVACEAPCVIPVPTRTTLSCDRVDGANANVSYRAFSPEGPVFVSSCVGELDAGVLLFSRFHSCSARNPEFVICELPALPPGTYAIAGSAALVVPADGGVSTCVE